MGPSMEARDGAVMVYRYSRIAGLASIGFAFLKLRGLLLPTASGVKWQLVVLSGLIIALILTWTATTFRLRTLWIVFINAGAFFLAAARFSAPSDSFLIFPTPSGLATLWTGLDRAFDVIRNGVQPVRPSTGIVIILTALFWLLGTLLVLGLSKAHPFVALLPPLVVALQFATLDRNNGGPVPIAAFVTLVAASLLFITLDERDRTAGRMTSIRSGTPSNALAPTSGLLVGLAVLAAVIGAGMLGPTVPRDGALAWRTPGGLGFGFFGSVTYNPYVEIHDGLVSQEGIPLFRAKLSGGVPPDEVSFRLLTLETYRDGQWSAGRPHVFPLSEAPFEQPGHEYAGATRSVTADVEILGLAQEWLPAPYAVVGVTGADVEAFRIRSADTALVFRGDRTYRNMEYQVISEVPNIEPEAIAGAPGGAFSPLFAAAIEAGESVPSIVESGIRELPDPDRYTDLPTNIDDRIGEQAAGLTARLVTPFEKGLAIEHWFRETGGFTYDLDIDQGHADDLIASWLFDDSPENETYRRGYCEQFATSMAVMTRSIGIPTRVVLGFTPGTEISLNEVMVLDRNAHSWVELWIPAVGWVSFDPTPRGDEASPAPSYESLSASLGFEIAAYLDQVPETVRTEDDPAGNTVGAGSIPDDRRREIELAGAGAGIGSSSSTPPWISIIVFVIALFLLGLGAIPTVKWVRRRNRMRRLENGDISAGWEEIVVRLTDFGAEPSRSATPTEVAARVDAVMQPLAAVYTRSVYGDPATITDEHERTARSSMLETSARLTTRHSPIERLRSHYRMGSLLRRFRS